VIITVKVGADVNVRGVYGNIGDIRSAAETEFRFCPVGFFSAVGASFH
jgi:hypothetical protein